MNLPYIFSFVLKKSNYQRTDKFALDKCPFNAHCPMGNARATKFLNGHCPHLPVPSFFLMGIAHVCPCPKIVPVTHHYHQVRAVGCAVGIGLGTG